MKLECQILLNSPPWTYWLDPPLRRTALALLILVSIPLFRLPSLVNTTARYLTSPPAAVYFWSRAEYTALGVLRDTIPQNFSADIRSCLITRIRKSIKCVLKTLLRRPTPAVPSSPQKANGLSFSSPQWHPRRRVDDWLSNSYSPGLSKIFGRGPHKLLHNSSRPGHLA